MKPKNILFLMTDQQRLDHTGFGGGKVETPNIDRLAESVGFTCCQTVNPICTPARTALLAGKYTHQIGTLDMSGDLSRQYPTFMQALQRAGYHSSGIGKFHFLQTWQWSRERGKGIDLVGIKDQMKEYGYDYIWETSGKQLAVKNYCDYAKYLDDKGLLEDYRDFVQARGKNFNNPNTVEDDGVPWPFAEEDYVDVVTGDKIVECIKNRPADQPFYIFGSFCSPHKPMDPPQRYLDMVDYEEEDDFIPGAQEITPEEKKALWKRRRAYKGMIKLIDDQIGRICSTLEDEGILDETVILFTSDHGEMMGDHYHIQKGVPWKESLTVPTAIRHPDYLRKDINHSPVEITDLTATMLEVAGLDPQSELSKSWPKLNNIVPCRSLMPIVKGEREKIRDFSFSECRGNWYAVQTERWKYVRFPRDGTPDDKKELLYDLVNDPDEQCDASDEYPDVLEWCRNRYFHILETTPPGQTSWAPLIGER